MKEGWEVKTLGEVCTFENGDRGKNYPSRSKFVEDGIPFVNAGHLGNKKIQFKEMNFISKKTYDLISRGKFREGDLLFCLRGSLGKFALVENGMTGAIASSLVIVRPSEDISSDYLSYFFDSSMCEKMIVQFAGGAAQPNLGAKDLMKFQIPLPPLSEQKEIVAILDEAFAAIDTAQANIEKNIANANELFQSRLNEIFSRKGAGWEEKRLGDVCDFVRGPFGGSLKKSFFKEDGYAVYEQKHAIHNHFNQLRYFIDEKKFNEMKRFELKPGDLIMSCSGVTLGRVAIAHENINRGIINQALLKLTPSNTIKAEFLKYWMESNIFQNIILSYSKGAAIPNVPAAKILKDIKISLPSIEQQENIIELIKEYEGQIKQLEKLYLTKSYSLEQLKKSLLQKAFAGELT